MAGVNATETGNEVSQPTLEFTSLEISDRGGRPHNKAKSTARRSLLLSRASIAFSPDFQSDSEIEALPLSRPVPVLIEVTEGESPLDRQMTR